MNSFARREDREFDIVVFGASGFTGNFVAEYLALRSLTGERPLRLALAGRDAERLEDVRASLRSPGDVGIIAADVTMPETMLAMAGRTRVVLSSVGPFELYGEPLVVACLAAGTDYADLAGEPIWIARMLASYREQAARTTARFAFCSGYDSIPAEMGVFLLQREFVRRFGAPAAHVDSLILHQDIRMSAGSRKSGKLLGERLRQDPALAMLMADPFAFTLEHRGPPQPEISGMIRDDETACWLAPSLMNFINTKVVHHANELLGLPWGRDFTYREATRISEADARQQLAQQARAASGDPEPPRRPHQEPSREHCMTSWWTTRFVAKAEIGEQLTLEITGQRDAGYASTAQMLAETGICLLESPAAPGMGHPVAMLGDPLIGKLTNHAGLTITRP